MTTIARTLVFWTPRFFGVLFALFISMFALDVFGEGRGFWETTLALLMHLIPAFAVGRTQELLYWFNVLQRQGRLSDLDIYVGVSAGAFVAANLCNGITSQQMVRPKRSASGCAKSRVLPPGCTGTFSASRASKIASKDTFPRHRTAMSL